MFQQPYIAQRLAETIIDDRVTRAQADRERRAPRRRGRRPSPGQSAPATVTRHRRTRASAV